jgi:hypothetical protein
MESILDVRDRVYLRDAGAHVGRSEEQTAALVWIVASRVREHGVHVMALEIENSGGHDSASHTDVVRYFSPPSGKMVTITPVSMRRASSSAPVSAAPDD